MTGQTPIRVILADDHAQMHSIVQQTLGAAPDIDLEGQGANGKEAINLCEELKPDIVLMDVVMPVMDGIEATEVLQAAMNDLI